MRAMLLAAAIASGAALAACGGDDADHDGEYGGDTTAAAPGAPSAPAAIDTPAVGSPSGAVVPPPTADALRSELAEKFDKMGGMQRVNIETDGSGVVTLSGAVKSADRKQTAEDAAAMVPGVVSVKNNIRVEE